jgi:hypothetical protein
MLGHLVSNAFQGGLNRPARSKHGLLQRLWAFFFRH